MEGLVGAGCISGMCSMLDCTDKRLVLVAIDGLRSVLRVRHILLSTRECGHPTSQLMLRVQVEKSRHPEHAGDPEHLLWLAEVDTCGGVDKLEELQNHEDEEVYIKAVSHEHPNAARTAQPASCVMAADWALGRVLHSGRGGGGCGGSSGSRTRGWRRRLGNTDSSIAIAAAVALSRSTTAPNL